MKAPFLFVLTLLLSGTFAFAETGIHCVVTDSRGTYEIVQKIDMSRPYVNSFVDRGNAGIHFGIKISNALNTIDTTIRDDHAAVEATGSGWINQCPKWSGSDVRLKTRYGTTFLSCSILGL